MFFFQCFWCYLSLCLLYYILYGANIRFYAQTGAPRWHRLNPADRIRQIPIGNATNFMVWIIARPLPREAEWHWKYYPNNSSHIPIRDLGDVHLTFSVGVAVLVIRNVTIHHYGNYSIWTRNRYGGWKDGDLLFRLVPKGTIFAFLYKHSNTNKYLTIF